MKDIQYLGHQVYGQLMTVHILLLECNKGARLKWMDFEVLEINEYAEEYDHLFFLRYTLLYIILHAS
jgi:hypothetical protein